MNKRHNPYNIQDVMIKHNLTEDQAILKINDLKNRTRGSLSRFIEKYGEVEGLNKYLEFCKKSANTREKFKERYGDEWEIRWAAYIKSKGSGRESLVERYGEETGIKKFEEAQVKRRLSLSKENQIKKYGEEGFKKICESKKSSIDTFILKYGEEYGRKKYAEACRRKARAPTLYGFIDLYGDEAGRKMYENRSMLVSPIYNFLRKKYGEEDAQTIYKKYKLKKDIVKDYDIKLDNITKAKSLRFINTSSGPTSSESVKFFQAIELYINRRLLYGSKRSELKLFDTELCKIYYYDCFDELSKTIVEFHGVAFHPKEGDINWVSPFGRSYQDAIEHDMRKKNIAEENGYKYIFIYSDEVKLQHDFDEKVRHISKLLNNESN